MQPKRLIIPFDLNNKIFSSPYINRNEHNYSELFKQIFDVMTPDFIKFSEEIKKLPNLNTFIVNEFIFDENEIDYFKQDIIVLALSIYFTCLNFKLFENQSFDYILEKLYSDYFILYHTELPNF